MESGLFEEGAVLMRRNAPQPSNRGLALFIGFVLTSFGLIVSLAFTSNVVQAQNGVDFIVITDSPGGNAIDNMTYFLGDNDTYFCSGYNNTLGFVGLEWCYWQNENWNVARIEQQDGYSTNFTTVGAGVTRVWAYSMNSTNGTIGDSTGILEVLPPNIDYIMIVDSPDGTPPGPGRWVGDRTYHVGETETYYAMAYYNGSAVGLVPANWTTTNSTVCGITAHGTSTFFEALDLGTCNVTAEYLGNYTNTTGTLTVVGGLDYILITDSPGGVEIGNMTYFLGENDTFYCSGYNNSLGFTGLEECYWESEDWQVGIVEPRWGTTVTFRTVGIGSTWVMAHIYDDPGQNVSYDITGELKVIPKNIDFIVIVDSSNIGGPNPAKWVGDKTYLIGDTDTFYAMAYNDTLGALGLVSSNWTTTNSTVCSITTPGTSTSFKALKDGICKVMAEFDTIYTNSTGTLNVTKAGLITVDDDGPADYKTIQEAIDAANPRDKIFVYAGTYPENVIVNKTVTLEGEDKEKVFVKGGGGTVFLITADDVSMKYFTIQDGYYGVFSDRTKGLVLSYNIIKNYTYGLYQNRTTDSWVTYNHILIGKYGVLTLEAHNDAIRYNLITDNTVYGAKDFNSELKNCFNWNTFRRNKIAYWYDPDQELSTLEFDGNIIEDNEIGIKVNGSSTVKLTNNTIINNDYGIYILDASPMVYNNTLQGNDIGIYCERSSSLLLENVIRGSNYGIYCEDASPEIRENDIDNSLDYAIHLVDVTGGTIIDNEVDGNEILVEDSHVDSVSLLSTELDSVSSTIDDVNLDATSSLKMMWWLKVRVLDEDGFVVSGAQVWVNDSLGSQIGAPRTASNGWTDSLLVTERVDTRDGSQSHNPYLITASKDGAFGSAQESVVQNKELMIVIVRPPETEIVDSYLPLGFLIVIGSTIALGAGLIAFFSSEVGKFALLSLIVPLYMKLRKSKILDHYDRGRVFQYIQMNPGEHYNQIKRDVGLANGSLVHHLTMLEKGGRIKSRRDGRFRRFYTMETKIPVTNGGILTEVQKRVVDAVKDIPGMTQKEISTLLGVHQSSINYQMRKLEERGLIRVERKGRKVHYYYVGKK
ncbi:MAG: right-handed parallel beta-helix repeat-containing protein [Methanobacteriota archaeon]|nr:MAG: right-handed parallel beta-helix repeat-containing protein [Euryarchaeota archaeon]